jgi:diacylglycerol kinase (ATP)
MKNKKSFRISDRIKSVGYAMEGIGTFFKTQHNAWIHTFATVVVIAAGFILKVSNFEWCWLISAIAMVFIAEMFNTAIEFLTDIASPDIHPKAKVVKDVAAGAVLIASIASVIIGLIIFLPKILFLL